MGVCSLCDRIPLCEPTIFLALYFINCQIVQFLCVFLKLRVRVIKLNSLFLYLLYSFIILLIHDGVFCCANRQIKVVLDLEVGFIFLKI